MKIYSIPIPKAKLDAIPMAERDFYFHMGHLRNEVMVLMKMQHWSMNAAANDPIFRDVNGSQTFILSVVLAGKLREGWELVCKTYFATKLSLSIGNDLPDKAKLSLQELKKYFGKNNLIHNVRNAFGFHYDPAAITARLSAVEATDDLRMFIGESSANVFYQMSETIVGSTLLETITPSDFEDAARRFYREVTAVNHWFIDFCDGCLDYLRDQYLGTNFEELNAKVIEIRQPPNRHELQLPFFAS